MCSITSNTPIAESDCFLKFASSKVEFKIFINPLRFALITPFPGSTRTVQIPESSSPFETKPFPPPISKKISRVQYFFMLVIIQLFLC